MRWNYFVAALLTSMGALLASGSAAPAKEKTLCFHTQWVNYEDREEHQTASYFLRELPRQAMLIAARDELRLATRDQTLGETMLSSDRADHLLLAEKAIRNKKALHLRLLQFEEKDSEEWTKRPSEKSPAWKKTYPYRPGLVVQHLDLVTKMELASRTDFVDALKAAGYSKTKSKQTPIAKEIEASWQQRLLEPDFITQFAVVRECHQAIAADGENEQRLGVLARGYANLCLMTHHQKNALTFTYASRSLLYAQRMTAIGEENPSDFALWCRAYAWAVTGFHHIAISNLETLEQRQSKPTAWRRLIKPYSEFNKPGLTVLSVQESTLKPMAVLLKFQLDSAMRYPQWMLESGSEVIKSAPTAYGVYGEMARYGFTLATTRTGARTAPLALGRFAPESIRKIPSLPEPVAEIVSGNPAGNEKLEKLGESAFPFVVLL